MRFVSIPGFCDDFFPFWPCLKTIFKGFVSFFQIDPSKVPTRESHFVSFWLTFRSQGYGGSRTRRHESRDLATTIGASYGARKDSEGLSFHETKGP